MNINEKVKFDKRRSEAGGTVIEIEGTIDEDTSFEPIMNLSGPVTFNFKELKGINSCGIRNWVNYLKALGNITIHYEQCPPLVVRQMNMVPSFLGNAEVDSVFVPYVCDECEKEQMVLASAKEFQGGIKEVFPCDCGDGEMELDGHPKQYFAFTKTTI